MLIGHIAATVGHCVVSCTIPKFARAATDFQYWNNERKTECHLIQYAAFYNA